MFQTELCFYQVVDVVLDFSVLLRDYNKLQIQGWFNPFQPIVAFHIETIHLIGTANQMTGFYMKCNIRLTWGKWVDNK